MDQQDETDSVTSPDPHRTKALMDQTLAKIERTKEAMKAEQLAKDGKNLNLNYMYLVGKASLSLFEVWRT